MRILHLEDSVVDHHLVCRALSQDDIDFEILRVDSLAEFAAQWHSSHFDLVLADYRLLGFTALEAWESISSAPKKPIFILVSGAIGETAAVSAIQHGIDDYVHKDDMGRLGRVIKRAVVIHQLQIEKKKTELELFHSQQQLAEFAEHLQSTIEKERAEIAREIHDDIGGSLAAANLDLSWIARNSLSEDTQSHATAAVKMISHAMGASQRIMLNLRPSILDQGLLPAIQWLASSFEARTSARVTIKASKNFFDVPSSIALVAYRTAQEALTNCSKYAQNGWIGLDA